MANNIVQINSNGSVNVTTQTSNDIVSVITVGPQGPQGPQGEPGDGFPFDGGVAQVTGSLQVTGSSILTGNLNVSEGITGSLLGTSSWAINSLTASYALNASGVDTSSLVTTSSFNNFTSSYNTGSFSGSFIGVFTGSLLGTASKVTIGGLGANVYPLAIISPSGEIVTASGFTFNGSSKFFNLPSDYTLYMPGASTVNAGTFLGNVTGNVTGNLTGTSSWASNATNATVASTVSITSNGSNSSFYDLIYNTDPNKINKSSLSNLTFQPGVAGVSSGILRLTGSFNLSGSININNGNITAGTGSFNTINAEVLKVTYISSSVVYSSGSNTFGSSSSNTQTLIGTVTATGSAFTWNGNTILTEADTASMTVASASWATTASYALNAGVDQGITGSLLKTASVSLNTLTFTKGDGSEFYLTIDTGSGGGGSVGTLAQVTALGAVTTTPITASIISASSFTGSLFGTSSWAVSSSRTISSSYALTASYALNGGSGGGSNLGSIFITLYDGGANLTTGKKDTPVYVPYNGTCTGWEMLAYNSSNNLMTASCVVDVISGRFTTLPISTANSIAGTEKPTLTNQSSSFSSSLSTWTSLTAGDYIQAEIESVSTGVAKITVAVKVTKS